MKKTLFLAFLGLIGLAFLLGCAQETPIILPSEGLDANMTLVQDANFDSETLTTCDANFIDGVLSATTCS